MRHREAFLQQRGDLPLTQPPAPAGQRRTIERQVLPEHHLAAEILKIRVLDPPVAQRLVREILHVLEDEQSGYQSCRQRWLSRPGSTDRTEASRQEVPINLRRQTHQRMAKPVAMVADAIRDCSHRKAIVLDAFAGSGTTLIAAEKTGRRGYGIEIDPAYCDVTIRRLHAVCGLDAVLDATGQPFAEIEALLRAAAAPTPVEAAPRLEGAT